MSAPMARALLALLALDVERAASLEEIVDGLWADPPNRCINVVQQYVAGLRRALGSEVIQTHGRAYRLAVPTEAVDLVRFREWTRAAYAAQRLGDAGRANQDLQRALDLWRGQALADLPDCPFVEPTRVALSSEREHAQLVLLDGMVTDGRAADALPDLQRTVAERPLDEGVAGLLVRALAAVGRQADALAAFEATRARLVDELGLDPGPGLRAAQAAVLEQRWPSPSPIPSRGESCRRAACRGRGPRSSDGRANSMPSSSSSTRLQRRS